MPVELAGDRRLGQQMALAGRADDDFDFVPLRLVGRHDHATGDVDQFLLLPEHMVQRRQAGGQRLHSRPRIGRQRSMPGPAGRVEIVRDRKQDFHSCARLVLCPTFELGLALASRLATPGGV
ncbi:MAG TPA: hypothetical protein VMV10_00800 [Pirellulales bacterium]|nr:hypothetical protein [Pirellulales bacterium]